MQKTQAKRKKIVSDKEVLAEIKELRKGLERMEKLIKKAKKRAKEQET